jgi:hypothetical protein
MSHMIYQTNNNFIGNKNGIPKSRQKHFGTNFESKHKRII